MSQEPERCLTNSPTQFTSDETNDPNLFLSFDQIPLVREMSLSFSYISYSLSPLLCWGKDDYKDTTKRKKNVRKGGWGYRCHWQLIRYFNRLFVQTRTPHLSQILFFNLLPTDWVWSESSTFTLLKSPVCPLLVESWPVVIPCTTEVRHPRVLEYD